MMRYGIPAYRLPRDVMGAEVDRIAALGVGIASDYWVEDLEQERREGAFDAVFVAVGALSPSGSTYPPPMPSTSSTPCRSCGESPRALTP